MPSIPWSTTRWRSSIVPKTCEGQWWWNGHATSWNKRSFKICCWIHALHLCTSVFSRFLYGFVLLHLSPQPSFASLYCQGFQGWLHITQIQWTDLQYWWGPLLRDAGKHQKIASTAPPACELESVVVLAPALAWAWITRPKMTFGMWESQIQNDYLVWILMNSVDTAW